MNVFITGAAGGLGRTLANECARRGYDLFLTDINADGLNHIKEGLTRRFGVNVAVHACDMTSEQGVNEMMAMIDARNMRFDMLLNVAGIDFEGGFLTRGRETIVKIVALNNAATLRVTHAVLSRRREAARFTVLFVSSLASMFPMPLKATYAASKRFLYDFALALREELKPENVSVMVLCPGGLATTNEAMSGIAAQGFWGSATTNKLEAIARKVVDRALKGKAVYIPGIINNALVFLGRIVPRSLVTAIVFSRFSGAQKKWLDTGDGEAEIKHA
ncbi:MAG TPA: SDR family NAD(P)-dependent oxidoreductase [Candidatus Limiplasma sp.]|nr:SDR family NAD(P)-dependent oxidoreductase [Candidatus Limiplasma sp.]HRX07909.1 SDR family NAD(P)-dependent oxidoreductase [Candidatus Limiplasma sp.]